MQVPDQPIHNLLNAREKSELDSYLDSIRGSVPETFAEYAMAKMKEKGMTRAQLYRKAKIERTYLYQILDGRKNPRRDKIIAISLALGLDIDETQTGLEIAHEGILYPKDRRDTIILFAINTKADISGTNELLEEYGELALK